MLRANGVTSLVGSQVPGMTLPAILDVSMEVVPHPLLSEPALVQLERQSLPMELQQRALSIEQQQRVQVMERQQRAPKVDRQQRPPTVGPQERAPVMEL